MSSSSIALRRHLLGFDCSNARARSSANVPGRVFGARRLCLEPLEERVLLSVISGTTFEDRDGDAVRDVGEPGMSGVMIYLDQNDNGQLDSGEPTQATDANGDYAFTGLGAGNYVVRQLSPANYRQTSPAVTPNRLFAVNGSSSPRTIVELDPATGNLLNQFSTPVSGFTSFGLAFDGSALYFVADAGTDVLYKLDPNTGGIQGSRTLPSGAYDGLAALGPYVYVIESNADKVSEINPSDLSIRGSFNLARPAGKQYSGGLGEISSPDALIATTSYSYPTPPDIVFVNPQNGSVLSSFGSGVSSSAYGATAIGQEVFIGFSDSKIRVYSRTGSLLRTINESFQAYALAGKAGGGAYRVTLSEADATGLDFGDQSTLGEIHGTVFQDPNGNGQRDPGESAISGMTVYVDLNDNRTLDASEPTDVTDCDGQYEFAGLSPGNYVVRQSLGPYYQQTWPVARPDRLFTVNTSSSPNKIVELNPATGAVLNQFTTPAGSFWNQGLAFGGTVLYYLPDSGSSDILYQLDPNNGTVLRQTTLPSGTYDGLATLNGLVYAFDTSADVVRVFDPVANKVVMTIDAKANNPAISFSGGLGEITGFDALIATTTTNTVVFLDPNTGKSMSSFDHGISGTDYGATSIGGKVYLGFSNGAIRVYDRAGGSPLQTFTEGFSIYSLGGRTGVDNAQRVKLVPAQILTGLDFGDDALPVANADGPYGVAEGGSVALDGSATTDPDQDPATLLYQWDFNYDGQTFHPVAAGVRPVFSASDLDSGTMRKVALRVTDAAGASSLATTTVTVTNVAPTVAINDAPPSGREGTAISLSSTVTDPGPHDTFTYAWSVTKDGVGFATGSDAAFTFTPDDNAAYVVTLTVTDKDGGVGADSKTITVSNVAPYLWGSSLGGTIQEHDSAGVWIGFADWGFADSHLVTIDWGDPNAAADSTFSLPAPKDLTAGAVICSLTDDARLTITNLDATWGAVGFYVEHQYLDDGPAPGNGTPSDVSTMAVTISDDDGGITFVSAPLTVNNTTPYLTWYSAPGGSLPENSAAEMWMGFADWGVLDAHTVVIDWDDPNATAGSTFALPATKDLHLGDIFASSTDNATLTITNVDPTWGGVDFHVSPHTYLDDGVAPGNGTTSDMSTMVVTIRDDDGGEVVRAFEINIKNIAPYLTAYPGPYSIPENTTTGIWLGFQDPGLLDQHVVVIDWDDPNAPAESTFALRATKDLNTGDVVASSTDDSTLTITYVNMDFGTVELLVSPHTYLDDGLAPGNGTPSDISNMMLTIRDDDGGELVRAFEVTVANVAPVVTGLTSEATFDAPGAEGQPVQVAASFADLGTLDTHQATIDWGDGTPPEAAAVVETGGTGSVAASHAYAHGGVYRVSLTLTDDDTGAATEGTTAVVIGAGVHDGILQVVGTPAADVVSINDTGTGLIEVHASFFQEAGVRTFPVAGIERIRVWLGAGDDQFSIAGSVYLPAIVGGDDGNDHMTAGGGATVLLGDSGDDTLIGSTNRDILIGGLGADRLVGRPEDDILIGGTTQYDANDAALLALMAEWTSDRLLDVRIDNVRNGTGPILGETGIKLVKDLTVFSDGALDQLTGCSGQDWFFFDPLEDRATDEKTGETIS